MAGITGKDTVLTDYAATLASDAPKGRSLTQDALRPTDRPRATRTS